MADSDTPDDGPSLEMPSFSLRRRRKDTPADPAAPLAEPEAERGPAVEPEPITATAPVVAHEAVAEPEPGPTAVIPAAAAVEPEPTASRRREHAVRLPGAAAAVVAGVVVGLAAALAGVLLGAGCEAVRGTSACGGAIGFPALVATLVVLAWLGGLLLRVLGVGEAGSTSILAVGIGAVLVLVVLLGDLDRWWAALALPAVGAVAYAVAWWVTAVVAASDSDSEVPEPYDVR